MGLGPECSVLGGQDRPLTPCCGVCGTAAVASGAAGCSGHLRSVAGEPAARRLAGRQPRDRRPTTAADVTGRRAAEERRPASRPGGRPGQTRQRPSRGRLRAGWLQLRPSLTQESFTFILCPANESAKIDRRLAASALQPADRGGGGPSPHHMTVPSPGQALTQFPWKKKENNV